MPDPTTIVRLDVEPVDLPLRQSFGIAGGDTVVVESAVVTVQLADGTRGFGEASPLPAYNGETRARTLEAVEAARTAVEGEDVRAFRRIAAGLTARAAASGSARCAVETAVLDALTRRSKMPLWAFCGGAQASLSTDVTLPIASVDEASRAAARWAGEGFTRLKIKVGGTHAGDDLARILAAHQAAPSAELMLDGNGGLTAEAALDLLADLRAHQIIPVLFEQPVPGPDLDGMAEVSRRGGVPVAADESVVTAADALRVAARGAAHVVNIKLMKSGVVEALAVAAAARAAGLDLMIGGMIEARMANAMSACFAAGLGGFSFVDLDTPLFFARDPFQGGPAQQGPQLDLTPIEAGHGASYQPPASAAPR